MNMLRRFHTAALLVCLSLWLGITQGFGPPCSRSLVRRHGEGSA